MEADVTESWKQRSAEIAAEGKRTHQTSARANGQARYHLLSFCIKEWRLEKGRKKGMKMIVIMKYLYLVVGCCETLIGTEMRLTFRGHNLQHQNH